MRFDQQILQGLVVRLRVDDYVRILAREHAATPLGMGFGKSHFSSPRDKFKLLYLAQDVKTAVAETIIRDRFEGKTDRLVLQRATMEARPFETFGQACLRLKGVLERRIEHNPVACPYEVVRVQS